LKRLVGRKDVHVCDHAGQEEANRHASAIAKQQTRADQQRYTNVIPNVLAP
jgi:hypothetical protein